MKRLLALSLLVLAAGPIAQAQAQAQAQAVEYVKVCDLYGAFYYYLPGTDICVNANTGHTKKATEGGLVNGLTQTEQDALDGQEGSAIGLALPGTIVDPGKHFGFSAHISTFNGLGAVGLGGAFRLNDNVVFDGGVGVGLNYGTMGGRAGLNVSW